MTKKRAFVRYTKSGKIVPGSLILTSGSYPDKPALWKEVSTDNYSKQPVILTYTPENVGELMNFQLKCNGTLIMYIEDWSIQGNNVDDLVININTRLMLFGTFTSIDNTTIQLEMPWELAQALCPNGILTMIIEQY